MENSQECTDYSENVSINSIVNMQAKNKSEVSDVSIYDSNFSGSSLKSCNSTPKFTPSNKQLSNVNRISDEKSLIRKKINKNEISELKKIELGFVKEMDFAKINLSEPRNKNEASVPTKNSVISLLNLEILTETINIDSKGLEHTETPLIEEIITMIDKISKNIPGSELSKNKFSTEYYKKWFLEYNTVANKITNTYSKGNEIMKAEYYQKLNNESLKIIRSLIYYYSNLTEFYNRERKNNKKQYNNNIILKKDNIKLSHLLKSVENNKVKIRDDIKKTISNQEFIQIYDCDIVRKVSVQISTDENNEVSISNMDNDLSVNLARIDSINEVSMLRTGRHQDAHNYREGILKITQEYNGLYDRTRNEYIERLIEKQKDHDMEIKLILSSHKEDIDKMNEYFIEEKRKITEVHDKQLNELLQETKRKMDTLKSDHSLELRLVQQKYNQMISDNEKEKNSSIQAFKIKFEHILIDMESNKNREILNLQIKYEDKINELKEYYKNIINDLELELQRKELLYQDEKKMIVDEFVSAHKREIEQIRTQSSISELSKSGDLYYTEKDTLLSNNLDETSISEKTEELDRSRNIDNNNIKYKEISKRLDNITLRSSAIGLISEKSDINHDNTANFGKTMTTTTASTNTLTTLSSSSAIPSNNIFIND
ncbi:hypothetical protein FG386_002389 [Cryptosporidium ryanae]|uniref:uncharacterized protein n=1 Tax=Cryptosporidium ryanae TaxID=515981 RepID=UPI00351A3F47|nr:hypothetical protein FG386_002389 [Cryptosporidium ryanae]